MATPTLSPAARPYGGRIHAQLDDGLVGQLNREWQTLVTLASSDDELRRWGLESPALAPYTTLSQLQDHCEQSGGAQADAVLFALLAASAAGATLAGRTVLQLMLPKVFRLFLYRLHVQGAEGLGNSEHEAQAAAVSAMWEAIATYPLHRQSSVAGNLGLTALSRLRRRATGFCTVPATDEWFNELEGEDTAPVGLVEALTYVEADNSQVDVHELLEFARARGAISGADDELLRLTYLQGVPSERLAIQMGVSPASLRKRVSRAVGRLQRLALDMQVRADGAVRSQAA